MAGLFENSLTAFVEHVDKVNLQENINVNDKLDLKVTTTTLTESISTLETDVTEALAAVGRDLIKKRFDEVDNNLVLEAHSKFKGSTMARILDRADGATKKAMIEGMFDKLLGMDKTKMMVQKMVNMGVFESSKSKNLIVASVAAALSK